MSALTFANLIITHRAGDEEEKSFCELPIVFDTATYADYAADSRKESSYHLTLTDRPSSVFNT